MCASDLFHLSFFEGCFVNTPDFIGCQIKGNMYHSGHRIHVICDVPYHYCRNTTYVCGINGVWTFDKCLIPATERRLPITITIIVNSFISIWQCFIKQVSYNAKVIVLSVCFRPWLLRHFHIMNIILNIAYKCISKLFFYISLFCNFPLVYKYNVYFLF